MSILERIKRFLFGHRDPDHPLTEHERHETRPMSNYAEHARQANKILGAEDDVD